MKKKVKEEEWDSSEWQGRSKKQVRTNTQMSGCLFVILVSVLIWIGFIMLVKYLSETIQF